jgi:glycine/D-amino acid oxidase-like deaminating enzyme
MGRVDVAIVGGGVTGCSCAQALARSGLRVRVHEARQIASGASGRNGGFALRGTALSYVETRKRLGVERAAARRRSPVRPKKPLQRCLLVGRVPRHDGVWVAAGYSGHGNVLGLMCGELVAQAILGSPAPELAIFDPARLLS